MKKTFAFLAAVVFFFSAKAQSFEIGARYLAESNWFFNSNVSNSGGAPWNVSQNYDAVYSYSYGIHMAYNFSDHIGIETDLQLASLSQSYNGSFQNLGILPGPSGEGSGGQVYYGGESYRSTVTLNAVQIPVVFRFLAGNGAYFGLGPEVNIVENANYSATYRAGPMSSQSFAAGKYYAGSYFDAVLSFGNNIRISHSFFFNINLRFNYDFTDLKGVDAIGQNLKNGSLYSGSQPFYGSYQTTNAASAAFGIGFIYRIGHDF
jgi:hypothetical protein